MDYDVPAADESDIESFLWSLVHDEDEGWDYDAVSINRYGRLRMIFIWDGHQLYMWVEGPVLNGPPAWLNGGQGVDLEEGIRLGTRFTETGQLPGPFLRR